jgi:uncharacterized integral membrane protein
MQFRLFVSLSLLALVVVFVAQNAQAVELRFLFWRVALSQALLLFFVLAVGFGAGWILRTWIAWRRVRERPRSDDIDLRAGG